MSFCASDWEVHGFSGAFPSNCKTKPNFFIEAPFVPDDVFEELYWEDGQLRLYQKQVSSWAANAPAHTTRDHGVAPLHVGGYPASLNNDVDTIAAPSLPHFDPYTYAQNNLQSLARLAAEWEPDAGVPGLQAVVDGGKRIHQWNKGACVSTDSSLESTVTGISLQGPSLLMDPHVTICVKAESVTLHQVDEAVPIEKPDAITHTDALCVLHPTGTCCTDGGDIKIFSKSNRSDKSGDSAKRKVKDSNGSESPSEDLANRRLFSQGFSAKRSRAAEIHNKSERKRRERINKNLKVLQELIPNPNKVPSKTDKASLLGQAIEYLKALQAQIMVMSYRTGITIPPMLMSHDMLQPPHMGMGFGGGYFFMNASAKDVATPVYSSMRKTSSLKPLMPSPALPSPARLVGTGNDANYFPMVNVGLVRPPYQMQTHDMPVHHKAPSFL